MKHSSKLLGNIKPGLLFILSAPAGTGKTTLIEMLTAEFPCVVKNISYTTRQPRSNEKNGIDYHFISSSEFEKKIASDTFLEYVRLFDASYGSSRETVKKQLAEGKHVVLVIDTQGALQLKGKIDAVFIFLLPPSLEELEKRLIDRRTEAPEMIRKRLERAKKEILASVSYDYKIVNENLDSAYQVLKSILIAEEHRNRERGNQ